MDLPFLHRTTPLADKPLSDEHASELERLMDALADKQRLKIVSLLLHDGGHGLCVGDLRKALQISQPTVSHHLKRLVHVGVLIRQREGNFVRFRIAPQALAQLRQLFTEPTLPGLT